VLPILAAPPVRATQTSFLLESKNKRNQIVLNEEGKLVYKKRNYWLVLTRTSLAGFNAPIDKPANVYCFSDTRKSPKCQPFRLFFGFFL